MPQLHNYNEDTELDSQNKHYVETPAGQTRYVTSENLFGGLRMFANSLTRNLQRAIDQTAYTNVSGFTFGTTGTSKFYVNNNVVYLTSGDSGTPDGIWYTADDGATWTNKTTASGLGSNLCRQIYINNNKIYVATSGGLSISSDGGTSFTNYTTANGLTENTCYSVHAIGDTIIVGTTGYVSYSIDAGATWINQSIGTLSKPVVYIDGDKMYAMSQTTGIIYRSINNALFTALYTLSTIGVSIYANGNTIYIAGSSGGGGAFLYSTDGGVTFNTKTTADGLGSNACFDIAVHNNKIYVATLGGLSISSDSAASFTNYTTANGLASNQCYGVFVSSNSKIYVLTYNGVGTGRLNISATIWQRIDTGTGTIIEHDPTTASIDEYATPTGAALSTATLTQIMRKTISLITSYLKFFISESTDATSSTDVSASFRTSGGAAIAKKAYVGTDLSVGGNVISTLSGSDTTDSSSSVTGAWKTAGGLGVAKKAYIGTDIRAGGNIYAATAPTEWAADTHAGFGSTDTRIPYFTNVRTNNILNSDITVTNNSTNGCKVLINTAGIYSFTFSSDGGAASVNHIGLSLNSTELTTTISAIAVQNRIAIDTCQISNTANVSIMRWCAVNDVIRPHTSGVSPASSDFDRFSVIKIL